MQGSATGVPASAPAFRPSLEQHVNEVRATRNSKETAPKISFARMQWWCRPWAIFSRLFPSYSQIFVLTATPETYETARCPGDCSGHGTCMTIADLARFYGPDYIQPGTGGDGIGPTYSNWDAQSTTACYCDQGHFGADCSNREWQLRPIR